MDVPFRKLVVQLPATEAKQKKADKNGTYKQ